MTRTVFISSCIRGMEELRSGARTAIEALGLMPIMVEDLSAASTTPRGACLDGVRRSDIVVLIVGPRYGDPLPSGLSATEEEVAEARRIGKPVIVLKVRGDIDVRQAAFLRRLGDWYGGSFYREVGSRDDLIRELVSALQDHQRAPDLQVLAGMVAKRLECVALGYRARGIVNLRPRLSLAWVPAAADGLVDEAVLFGSLPDAAVDLLVAGPHHLVEQRPRVVRERDRLVLCEGSTQTSVLGLEAILWMDGSVAIGAPVPRTGEGRMQEALADMLHVPPALVQQQLGRMMAFAGGVTAVLDPDGVVRQGMLQIVLENLGMAHLKDPPGGSRHQGIPIRSLHGHDVLSAPSRPIRFARADLRHDSGQIARLVGYLQRGSEEAAVGGEGVQ